MELQEFVNKYNGKFVDYDGCYGFQCVDLIRKYQSEVLKISGYSIPPAIYAKYMFTRFSNSGDENFIKIYNQRYNYPLPGDIVFWGWRWPTTGIAGHCAVCTGGNVNQFISFDQNYPTKQPCKYVNHNYRGVIGWLRPKNLIK